AVDGHAVVGAVPAAVRMTNALTIGYATAVTSIDTPLGPAGTTFRGHQFHYSATDPPGDALLLSGRFGNGPSGFGNPTMLASYLHQHLAASPQLAEQFVASAAC